MAGEGKMSELLGNSLQKNHEGGFTLVDTDQSEGLGEKEYVGLYFSAQWCPPCRAFKPILIEFYNKLKQADANKLEIVFVSSDKDDELFKAYAKEMPWLALPFVDREKKNALSKKFKIQGIPTLVIVDAKTGEAITDKGREQVGSDPEGAMFPWFPKSVNDIFIGEDLSAADKKTFVKGDFPENLEGKVIGLYFSAHWCPPCRAFTPQLAEKYKELKDAGKPFEIVFVSSDKSEEQYHEYLSEMPWLALPYKDPRCKSFSNKFDISGIPALVLVNAEGKVITTEGRATIMEAPIKEFPYKMPMIKSVSRRFVETLQESKCLVYFTDSPEDAESCKAAMSSIAKEYYKDGDEQDLYFFVGNTSEDLCESLYKYLMGPEIRRCIAITDLGASQVYRHKAEDGWAVSEDSIREFVAQFKDNKIEASNME
ncbi:nucleoredoxin-like [Mizuhopecten yessoensis]|uniref:nucleoredoxin-like n=1 Tax=Mizuhopecten yessoensis TaxID=6573 RepID=UPI000B45CFF7|nr:nucleoredoxin-like [Mizuhopecten yessoensis]